MSETKAAPIPAPGLASEDFAQGMICYSKQDYAGAIGWFVRAAERGDASAQFNLGLMYTVGRGVARDHAQAVYWYQRAAEKGLAAAQANLGLMFDTGQGVAQDAGQAVFWYRKSAEQGFAAAQANLGVMCALGKGVEQDLVEALMWFNLGAANGNEEAHQNRDALKQQMNRTEVTAATRRTKAWLKQHGSERGVDVVRPR